MSLDKGVFDRFDNVTAKIVVKGSYDDYENTYALEDVGIARGGLQPYSGGLAEKEYGLKTECQYIFYFHSGSPIKTGMYLLVQEMACKAVYVAGWGMGPVVLLKEVELRGRRE